MRPRIHFRVGKIAKWTGLILAALVALAIGTLLVFPWNWLKSSISGRASSSTHRTVAIDGTLDLQWSLVPRVTVTKLRVANADWAGPDDMLRVEQLQFRVDLWQLLKGSVDLPDVTIVGANLDLQKNKKGDANWSLSPASEAGAAAKATLPSDRTEVPKIGHLSIEGSTIRYRDPARSIDVKSEIRNARGESDSADELVSLTGKGSFAGKPFTLRARGASILRLQDKNAPYPAKIDVSVGETRIGFDGTLTNPLHPEVFDIALKLSGPSLAELFPIFGIPLPPTPPYRLGGRLRRDGDRWTVDALDGAVGDSNLRGGLTIDAGRTPPFMRANLESKLLDFDDLAGFIGATPGTGQGETSSARQQAAAETKSQNRRVLPDMPINLQRLRAMDMTVDYSGRRINAPKLPLENLHARLELRDGLLTLKPLKFGVAGGTIGGTLVLDGRKDTPRVSTNLVVRRLSLKPFFAGSDMADFTSGRIGGRIDLAGNGRSLAQVLANSDGRTAVAMAGGSLSPLLVELIGLDIGEALAVVVSDTKTPVPIRCAFGQFKVHKGSMQTDGIVVDTTDSTLIGTGAINLGTEKLAMEVRADPKDVSLLSANAPIAITGTFRDPKIEIDPTKTAGEGLFDKIVSLADPILALLPFVDLGTAKDRDCGALLHGDVKGSKRESKKNK